MNSIAKKSTESKFIDHDAQAEFRCSDESLRDVFTSALDMLSIAWRCRWTGSEYHCIVDCPQKRYNRIWQVVISLMNTRDKDKREKLFNILRQL